jgi:hypothetical protein
MGKRATQPAFRAYTIASREGQPDFWIPVGAAFKHNDSAGFNIILQALPLDGRIVLRPVKDRPAGDSAEA